MIRRVKLIATATAVAVVGLVALTGCSNDPTVPEGFQGSSTPPGARLEQGEVLGRTAMVWRNPQTDAARYGKVILDPVAVYRGPDASYGDLSEQDIQHLADFAKREYTRALGPYLTSTPGPGVARLKLTIAGAEGNVPVVSTVSRIAPVGLVVNLGKQVADQPGSFTGSVTMAGQMTDAQSGAPIVSAVTKAYPAAMDIGATLTTRDAQEAAISQSADALRKRLDTLHAKTT